MAISYDPKIRSFHFRSIHPFLFMGTTSDRYAGWLGQIYSPEKYKGKIKRRSKKVGSKSFVEEILPVESVEEYFQHFSVLELDFTFYRPLKDQEGNPTQNYHTLRAYSQYLKKEDHLVLKVPQAFFAKKVWQQEVFGPNPTYLDARAFKNQFYEPALELVDPWLCGLLFEQEYHRKQDRPSAREVAQELDRFFEAIPKDPRYHVELRTESFLSPPLFEVLEKHGVGQVLSHWSWLPPLRRQFHLSGQRFLAASGDVIIRLMTPRGMRYEEAYAKAHPFDKLIHGMLQESMVQETARLAKEAIDRGFRANILINNRSGGNAPIIAQKVAAAFVRALPPPSTPA
ncbi:MAG: DUF72 domain-containing protein [Deltaproteobacteria bacterium]|nr:DUF72 domain-containing protein [Deltaproteobacteria bacterium]MBW1927680.1 DUF72 domain-containing protein [Deltaproteobacteria bacterium]